MLVGGGKKQRVLRGHDHLESTKQSSGLKFNKAKGFEINIQIEQPNSISIHQQLMDDGNKKLKIVTIYNSTKQNKTKSPPNAKLPQQQIEILSD